MKKRIISTLVTATVALTAFWGGQMTNATVQADEKESIFLDDITDWNTNGTELSLAMRDGTEMTVYKEDAVYSPERKQYLALDEIASVNMTATGFEIVTVDGEIYEFEEEK